MAILLCLDAYVPPPGIGSWACVDMNQDEGGCVTTNRYISRSKRRRDSLRACVHWSRGLALVDAVGVAQSTVSSRPSCSSSKTGSAKSEDYFASVSSNLDVGPSVENGSSSSYTDAVYPSWLCTLFYNVTELSSVLSCELKDLCSHSLVQQWESCNRQRDVFPLPRCTVVLVQEMLEMTGPDAELICYVANSCFDGLGVLSGYHLGCVPSQITEAQRSIMSICIRKVGRMLSRLASCEEPPPSENCFDRLCGPADGAGRSSVPLVADQCDVHPNCGRVDAQAYITDEMRECLESPSSLFKDDCDTLADFPALTGTSRKEYVRLMARELVSRKVDLVDSIKGGGTVFGVAKSSGRIRSVWHGHAVSDAATRPPKPRHLASPTALLDLETNHAAPYYMCKRDGLNMMTNWPLPACCDLSSGDPVS